MLGVDLGAKSIGWVVMEAGVDGDRGVEPQRMLDIGVRAFEAGVDGNIEQGKDESRATARRLSRGARRQLYRRAQRLRRTLRTLGETGLLPGAVASPPEKRHEYLSALDLRIRDSLLASGAEASAVDEKAVYLLRRACLDGKRSPEEVGRALFHLSQRRGFKSNRKDTSRKDDDKGEIKEGIKALGEEIGRSGSRTLGEYLATLDSHQVRIRNRWAARKMYLDEFDAIWNAQSPHHPDLMNAKARETIHHAIFHQRPLKSQAELIGFCGLEVTKRRAPLGCLVHQRFRLVQKVNDLNWIDENGELCGPLSVDDPRRRELIERLDVEGDLSESEVKKVLRLPKKSKLSLENGPAKSIPGNRTAEVLGRELGDTWKSWTPQQRESFVNELLSDMEQNQWQKRLAVRWGFPPEDVERIADIGLQEGYAAFSRRAMRKLLVLMEAGIPLATARKQLYGDRRHTPVMDILPAVDSRDTARWLGSVNNPAVIRALTEIRKVVNALIRKYGCKPLRIRIELGRDLRKNREDRQRETKRIEERTAERVGYVKAMRAKGLFLGHEPYRSDIDRWALAEECNWTCPYTGKPITPELLFGPDAQFDVEHIIPRSRRPDDSFANKTLCHVDENRAKGNRTPFEAYHGGPKWDEILARVRRFKDPGRRGKLRLFELEKIDDDFTNRDLNDTRYASRLAKEYLGVLYGGNDGVDETGVRRVQVCCGGITATLRNEWGLNTILRDVRTEEGWVPDPTDQRSPGEKLRDDHRHHAIDAVAIALAGPRTVQLLATAAGRAASEGRRRYAPLPEPWPGYRAEIIEAVKKIIVSHRANYSMSGSLHEQTNYSPLKPGRDDSGKPITEGKGKNQRPVEFRHVRKKLLGISPAQIQNIVDPRVREAVKQFLAGRDPKKVFKEGAPFPTLPNRNGPPRPIRRVRIREKVTVLTVGGARGVTGHQRHVAPGENNHLEVVEVLDSKGRPEWEIDHVVSRFEAFRRLRAGEPVVRTEWGPWKKLVMVLRRGDYVELTIDGKRQLMRVYVTGNGEIQCYGLSDARPKGSTHPDRNIGRFRSGGTWRAANPVKITVSPIGEVWRTP
jgi:CRISPR-associated endonuclease Csn1